MTTIQAQIPDYLAKLATEAASKERTTLDAIVAIALVTHVGTWQLREDVNLRVRKGNLRTFDQILARVPDVPPLPGDEL